MVELTYLSLKNYFFVRTFDISPCVFTQISIRRDRYNTFHRLHYQKNIKYLKKCDDDVLAHEGQDLALNLPIPFPTLPMLEG